jgi:hypothetical protein
MEIFPPLLQYGIELTSPCGELVFLELLHLEGRAPVVHLQDPDEVGYGEHPHKP